MAANSCYPLDPKDAPPPPLCYHRNFTVKHFTKSFHRTKRPAPTRWAALFLGAQNAPRQTPETRLA
jgi:hypothetical protein